MSTPRSSSDDRQAIIEGISFESLYREIDTEDVRGSRTGCLRRKVLYDIFVYGDVPGGT